MGYYYFDVDWGDDGWGFGEFLWVDEYVVEDYFNDCFVC